MKIKSFEGGFDKNLCYLIWCDKTKIGGLVDPSVEIAPIVDFIKKNKIKLSKILITHTHHDHIFYLDNFFQIFPDIDVLCHENHLVSFKYNIVKLTDFEIITLGHEIIIALHTPGHHADSVCYWNKDYNYLFTGDTLFVGRTGRTIGAKSNISHLYTSIYNELLKLPPKTIIYSGHHYGYKTSITLKENISLSSFFQCTSEDEFIAVMEKYEKNRRIS